MGKAFGLLFIAGLLWVGLEVYTEGTEHAFGGMFASMNTEPLNADSEDRLSTPKRAGLAVERAHEAANARLERQLGEGS
ncbi:MAG: hypothetical protein JRH01_21035 [Deltaproteobacteria bacterium]|nr:hypothetical protein [Deltaproteobacteria bacterium]MBW2395235.1 hypothetical protein [Deltaproteobacteria bacterium]